MSDTPRTDAKSVDHIGFYSCATVTSDFARQLERELAVSLENQCKAQAEVERLNNTLENTRISRATIIEDRNLLDQELAASKAEVERLKKELDAWDYGTRAKREQEARKKAEAEVERLTKRPFGCKCETFREKALGDGCEECNKALVIEMLTDERDELDAEVDRLTEKLTITEDELSDAREWLDERYKATSEADERAEKAEAEVDRLKELVKYAVWVLKSYNPKYAEEIEATLNPPPEPVNERAEKAEAEVERLKAQLSSSTPSSL